MDLSGAYDSIDLKVLFWKLEHQLGIADQYRNSDCVIKGKGCCSWPFGVACGLRRG
jgi:hypothetical protein